jgi:hypothetical protein
MSPSKAQRAALSAAQPPASPLSAVFHQSISPPRTNTFTHNEKSLYINDGSTQPYPSTIVSRRIIHA